DQVRTDLSFGEPVGTLFFARRGMLRCYQSEDWFPGCCSSAIARGRRVRRLIRRFLIASLGLGLIHLFLGFSVHSFASFFRFLTNSVGRFFCLSANRLGSLFGFFADCFGSFLGFFSRRFNSVLDSLSRFFCAFLCAFHCAFLAPSRQSRGHDQSHSKNRYLHHCLRFICCPCTRNVCSEVNACMMRRTVRHLIVSASCGR